METNSNAEKAAYVVFAVAILAGIIRGIGQWAKGKPEWMYYRHLVSGHLQDVVGPDKPIFGYLPGFKALLVPFVETEPAGFFVFILLNALSRIGIQWLVYTNFTTYRRDSVSLLWLAFCSAVPVGFVLQNNQLVAPAVFLTLLAFSRMRCGREWSAGLLFAVAVLIKTLPLPVLAFPLMRRQWRTVVAASFAIPILSIGLASMTDGLEVSIASHLRWPEQVLAQSPERLITHGQEPAHFHLNQSPSAEAVRLARESGIDHLVWLPKILSGGSFLLLAFLTSKRGHATTAFWSCAAGWLAWVAFAAPFGRYYYLLFMVPSAYALGLRAFSRFPHARHSWMTALCTVSLLLLVARSHNPLYATVASVTLFLHLFLSAGLYTRLANKTAGGDA